MNALVGIVHLDLNSIVFQGNIKVKQIDYIIVNKLVDMFKKSSNGY
jgi:hypothetical protein